MSLYSRRGVSAQKEEVHAAVSNLDQGLFPRAFCKVYPDFLNGDKDFINVMHADGAGTKGILAYLYWKETGDATVWRGIAQDAIVMNLDDLLCVGIYDQLLFNSTIDRNKNLIPAEVLKNIVDGSQEFFDQMSSYGVNIHYLGGETADVGDVVRTIAVNGTLTARWPKSRIITNEKIKAGNVIVGLASYGQASYESTYNSGIGSNGLTSARHDILEHYYADQFRESYDPALSQEVVYLGKHRIKDIPEILSPTRTYAPLMKKLLEDHFEHLNGLIHCSGGGQTKCLKYVPYGVNLIKDHLFEPPTIFKKIQEASHADDREMYQVFNMGCRMEIYCDPDFAPVIVREAHQFNIEAQVIGRVEESEKRGLVIKTPNGSLTF
ncbi:MAG: phosphoribosylformylglycinamidine cyclo-ligase [Bacteroidota bacterium]|nr:phosphoribosylformylglycinamidine cyclo-ligase [Bacteroidota bacterium]